MLQPVGLDKQAESAGVLRQQTLIVAAEAERKRRSLEEKRALVNSVLDSLALSKESIASAFNVSVGIYLYGYLSLPLCQTAPCETKLVVLFQQNVVPTGVVNVTELLPSTSATRADDSLQIGVEDVFLMRNLFCAVLSLRNPSKEW